MNITKYFFILSAMPVSLEPANDNAQRVLRWISLELFRKRALRLPN